jgi:hypothetical protein
MPNTFLTPLESLGPLLTSVALGATDARQIVRQRTFYHSTQNRGRSRVELRQEHFSNFLHSDLGLVHPTQAFLLLCYAHLPTLGWALYNSPSIQNHDSLPCS